MPLLDKKVQDQIGQALAPMIHPVKLVMFTQGEGGALECELCGETRQLLEEVAALSDRITLEVRDFVGDAALAESYHIDKIPAIAVLNDGPAPKDYGVRLYGIPSGYEFGTLIEDVLMVSRGDPQLTPQTLDELKRLTQPVRIQVFVTLTCPYCPRAVLLAHKLALASDLITSEMVEASEFPHLANRYQVYGVPRTVVNDVVHVEGAVPEAALVSQLMTVLDAEAMSQLQAQWQASLN